MKPTTMQAALRAGVFMLPLGLAGCGGGSSPEYCAGNPGSSLCPADSGTSVAAPKSAAPATSTAAPVPLFTTAPNSVSLNAGSSTTYTVSGGTPPYTATSGNTSKVVASVEGQTLAITGVSAGTASVAIVDSVGKAITINVIALGQGEAYAPLSITPEALAVSYCTTNIPFFFSGGVPPYTIYSTDYIVAKVSAALPFDKDKLYFTATLGPSGSPQTYTLTVLDSQSHTATATINVPQANPQCPLNPLLRISPASANFRATEIQAFEIIGGPDQKSEIAGEPNGDSFPQIKFSDSASGKPSEIVRVVSKGSASFMIQALKPGTTLMTVTTSDGQNANVVLNVL